MERIADPQRNVARKICLTAMGAERLPDSRALSIASLEQTLGIGALRASSSSSST
ncbi:hypothetical protein [Glutamicibacter arilaitensis]|uniref:hypothetical protein n=1 Tax=Glutamicibacter arilaitensis TaxID=256701 RepID=UPI003FD59E7F